MRTDIRDRIRGLRKRLRAVVFRDRVEDELRAEMAWHIEQETAANLDRGMSAADARHAALKAFGGVDLHAERVRDVRSFDWVDALRQDLTHAARSFRRTPGLVIAVVLTLALGIGGAVTIFTVVDTALLRPLPYPHPDRLVHILETTPEGRDFSVSDPNFLDFAERNRSLDGLFAYRLDAVVLEEGDVVERMSVVTASAGIFDVLGARPLAGRPYGAADDLHGANHRVALLSQGDAIRLFGGIDAAVGRTLQLDGASHTIIGIMPAVPFHDAGVWRPLAANPHGDRSDHWLGVIGRLAPGVHLTAAATDLAAISAGFGDEDPDVAGWGVRVEPLSVAIAGSRFRDAGVMLLACVGFLLLMACANVTNLLLGRATTRHTELGVRLALGIGRARLMRQLLTESALLAITGTAVGVASAYAALHALREARPSFVPRVEEIGVDVRVVLFSIVICVLTTMLIGVLPARHSMRTNLHDALKGGRRGGVSRGQLRVRNSLVAIQVALAALLLVGGGLMMRSLIQLQRVDIGFQVEHVYSVPLQVHSARYPEEWQIARFYNQVAAGLERIPGVIAAGGTAVDPFGGLNLVNDVTPVERADDVAASGFMQASWRVVTPGYFSAANVRLLRGRTFDDTDVYETERVAVITRSLAESAWPGEDAVGRRFYWGGTTGRTRTVIGVVEDVRDFDVTADAAPVLFMTSRQTSWQNMTMLVRTDGPVAGIEQSIREAVHAVDDATPVPLIRHVAAQRSASLAQPRAQAAIVGAFAIIALALAAVGIYGVLSFTVATRTQEIGVRIALGAPEATIRAAFLSSGLALAALGLMAGLAAAAALARLIRSILFDTAPLDPLTYGAVALLLGAVAFLATIVPATRAARTPPLTALRSE